MSIKLSDIADAISRTRSVAGFTPNVIKVHPARVHEVYGLCISGVIPGDTFVSSFVHVLGCILRIDEDSECPIDAIYLLYEDDSLDNPPTTE